MAMLSARLAVRATFDGFSSTVLSRSGHSGSGMLQGVAANGRGGAAPGQIGSPIDVVPGPDGRISPSAAAAIAALVTGTTGSGRADSPSAWSPLPSAAQLRQGADSGPRSAGMSPGPSAGGPSNTWMSMLGQSAAYQNPSSGTSGRVPPGGRMPLLPSPLQRTTQANPMPSPPQAPLPPAPAPRPPSPGIATLGSPGSDVTTGGGVLSAGIPALGSGANDSRSGRTEAPAVTSSTAGADDSGDFRYVHAVPVSALPPPAPAPQHQQHRLHHQQQQQQQQQWPRHRSVDNSSGVLPAMRAVPVGYAVAQLGAGGPTTSSPAGSITVGPPPAASGAAVPAGASGSAALVGMPGGSIEVPGSALFNTSNVPASAGAVTTEDPLMLAFGSHAGMRRASSMEMVMVGHASPSALGVGGGGGIAGAQLPAPLVSGMGRDSAGMRSLPGAQAGSSIPWREGIIHPRCVCAEGEQETANRFTGLWGRRNRRMLCSSCVVGFRQARPSAAVPPPPLSLTCAVCSRPSPPATTRLSAGHYTLHSHTSSNPQARLAILGQLGIGGGAGAGGGADDGYSVGAAPSVMPSGLPSTAMPHLKNSVLGKLIGTMFRCVEVARAGCWKASTRSRAAISAPLTASLAEPRVRSCVFGVWAQHSWSSGECTAWAHGAWRICSPLPYRCK